MRFLVPVPVVVLAEKLFYRASRLEVLLNSSHFVTEWCVGDGFILPFRG
jgi:hypothetical protein